MTEIPEERSVTVLLDDGQFCESPRWRDHSLWFSDIGAGKVRRIWPDGRQETVLSGMFTPSGLGWTESGDLLIACLHEGTVYRVGPDGVPRAFSGPEQHGNFNTNDMATVGSRSYVTCIARPYEEGMSHEELGAPTGTIILIDHETGLGRTVASGYRMPNGIAITPDGKQLIVAELYASRILQFDIAPDGSLSNEKVFANLESSPDGICLDAEGAVWAGAGKEFVRVDGSGRKLDSIPVPDWGCIACMLGGEDGRTLYMVVNKIDTPDDIFAGRAKSQLLSARVDVPAAAQPVSR